MISSSTITEQWKQLLQVIEFSVVPNTKSDITVTEINAVLSSYNLKVNQCVSIQADSCSAMVATARKFKHLVTDGGPSDSESEDDITVFEVEGQFSTKTNEPLREFAGCGAHRLNNSIWDSVDGMKFFKQLNDFSLKQRTKISEHSLVWPSCTIGICLKTHGKAERGQIFFKQLQFFAP